MKNVSINNNNYVYNNNLEPMQPIFYVNIIKRAL